MNVRRAQIEDAAEACVVLRRSIAELCYLDHGGDGEHLAKWLSNKTEENVRSWILGSHMFVAVEAGRIVGVAGMNNSGRVGLNYVSPDARFRGVSKALMLCLEDNARTLGIAECSLESSKTALRFYKALGYVPSTESDAGQVSDSMANMLSKRLEPSEISNSHIAGDSDPPN